VSTAFSRNPQICWESRTASPPGLPNRHRALPACTAAKSRVRAPARGSGRKPACASEGLPRGHSAGHELCIAGSRGRFCLGICLPLSYLIVRRAFPWGLKEVSLQVTAHRNRQLPWSYLPPQVIVRILPTHAGERGALYLPD